MAKIVNNTNEFKTAFENACKSALNEIGTTGKADLMANCVVHIIKPGEKYSGVPGTLRKGHAFKVTGVKKVVWTNNVPYAPYVEFSMFRKKGDRSWFRKTLRADTKKFNDILQKHLKKVGV